MVATYGMAIYRSSSNNNNSNCWMAIIKVNLC